MKPGSTCSVSLSSSSYFHVSWGPSGCWVIGTGWCPQGQGVDMSFAIQINPETKQRSLSLDSRVASQGEAKPRIEFGH